MHKNFGNKYFREKKFEHLNINIFQLKYNLLSIKIQFINANLKFILKFITG